MKRAASSAPKPAVPSWAWAALAALLAVQVWSGAAFVRASAPTYDEAVHLASGYSYWLPGPYRLNITDHPPLAEMWAAAPLLFLRPQLSRSHPDWLRMQRYAFADHFLYRNRVPPERMLDSARIFAFLTLIPLLLLALGAWALRLGGPVAAVAAVAAAVFCPVITSNLALVTTDGASAVFFFLVFALLSREDRSPRVWAAAGVCAGLALASKFNTILLGPLVGGMLLLEHGMKRAAPGGPIGPGDGGKRNRPAGERRERSGKRRKGREAARFPWPGVLLAALCAAAALLLIYRFHQIPLYWEGLSNTLSRLGRGRSTFLLGDYSNTGFLLYFPVALAIKTPLPVLLLSLGTAAFWLKGSRRERLWAVLPMLAYFLAANTSRTQIGIRHLLPMMPFLALLAGCGAAWLWERGPRVRWLVPALGVWLAASVLRAHPHHLAYFNEAAGGPSQGYRWLVDSNLDWGQDLKTLGRKLRELGDPPVYLSYFGTADPAAYGIRFVPVIKNWNLPREGDHVDPAASGRVLLAVSATSLQANYNPDRAVFAWLKEREPLEVLGHSMFLYDLTRDPEGRARLAAMLARPEHPLRSRGPHGTPERREAERARRAGLSKTLLL